MQNLTVIEKDLVPVYTTDTGEKVVYGSELYGVLEVKSRFNDWIRNRLNDCDAAENKDFESFSKILEKGGRPQTEYIIKLDTAKEMAMLERNEKGKQVRRYFIEVEKKYKQIVPTISADQFQELCQLVAKLNTRLDELGENAPLTEAEAKQVKTAIRKKAGELCGGWNNMAYHDKRIRTKLYAAMYKALRERFGVRSYKNILHKEFDEAIRLLNEFVPPKFIQTIINNTSSPRVMDLGYVQLGRKR